MALTTPNTTVTEAAKTEVEEQVQPAAVQQEEQVQAEAAPQTEAAAPQPQQTQEVAQRPAAAAPTPVAANKGIEAEMAEMGLDGLSIGGMSFDRIKLPSEGVFLYGPNEEDLGKEFDCVIQTTKAIYIVRQSDDDDAETFYSYQPDGQVDANGMDRTETLQEWKDDGFEKPSIKRYLEVLVQMHEVDEQGNEGARHGAMAMLSIPPASLQRISGYLFQLTKMRKLHPTQAVTTFQVGNKVKRDKNAFFPWNAVFKEVL